MANQTINLGTYANDGTGDDLLTAFRKVNANFTELYASVGVTNGTNLGAGTGVFAQRNTLTASLEFKTLTSTDSSVEITNTATTINLKNKSTLINDPTPQLGANLDVNGKRVIDTAGGGNVELPIFGLDVRAINGLIELMVASNGVDIDFGTVLQPTGSSGNPGDNGFTLDMNGTLGINGFIGNPSVSNLDFGPIG